MNELLLVLLLINGWFTVATGVLAVLFPRPMGLFCCRTGRWMAGIVRKFEPLMNEKARVDLDSMEKMYDDEHALKWSLIGGPVNIIVGSVMIYITSIYLP